MRALAALRPGRLCGIFCTFAVNLHCFLASPFISLSRILAWPGCSVSILFMWRAGPFWLAWVPSGAGCPAADMRGGTHAPQALGVSSSPFLGCALEVVACKQCNALLALHTYSQWVASRMAVWEGAGAVAGAGSVGSGGRSACSPPHPSASLPQPSPAPSACL